MKQNKIISAQATNICSTILVFKSLTQPFFLLLNYMLSDYQIGKLSNYV